ncbi:hypothetical protein EYR41_010243 [Orbilia oligospora]|uniref:Uncharacterized protein n=1 Tax=Orbilia oligospora TaxID=2813651 RepID=A0A7C8P372_ORBOL|nr:hypothetical protein TWF751_003557 [Orbilia oligospora]KAF3233134.1 hypothetical protein TWF128_003258 [Orbilia oligospora]KAF3275652.1 hypothetical protein TWF132_002653 [Orbilia oligospora]TGJ64173.1 hypothetical protein EYR41_010243 [Orbilia oligospora]
MGMEAKSGLVAILYIFSSTTSLDIAENGYFLGPKPETEEQHYSVERLHRTKPDPAPTNQVSSDCGGHGAHHSLSSLPWLADRPHGSLHENFFLICAHVLEGSRTF